MYRLRLQVMANDLFPQSDTFIISDPVFVPQSLTDIQETTLTVNGLDQRVLDFNAPARLPRHRDLSLHDR